MRLLERAGRALGFSAAGRPVRVWVNGMPGGDEVEVRPGTITELVPDGAVVYLAEPVDDVRWVLATPRDQGWGLDALWFSFIAVDAFSLEERRRLGHWFIRLGRGS